MVVHQLFGYIWRNVKSATDQISIKELADEHRRMHPNPTLVVDGKAVAIWLRVNKLEANLQDFDFTNYIKMIKEYVGAFQRHDITLVFFFGAGRTTNPWISHQPAFTKQEDGEIIASVFQRVKEGSPEQCNRVAPGMIALTRYILKYQCGCTVYCALTDTSREIAKFATDTPECFGILATNADHIILTEKPLFSSKNLQTETMRTNMFVRSEILKSLEMDYRQLKLLACLAGGFIRQDELDNLHRRISSSYVGRDKFLINNIKKYIKKKRWSGDDKELCDVSIDTGVREELLRKCMSYYDISFSEETVEDEDGTLSTLREKCIRCSVPCTAYSILLSKKFNRACLTEDLNDDSIPSVSSIYRPIRQRMYYLLFDMNVSIEEWCDYGKGDEGPSQVVRSVEVDIGENILPLKRRIEGNIEDEVKWKLLKACFGLSIPIDQLRNIEERFVFLCCLLNHLLHFEGINLEEFEVKAFVCQALLRNLSSSIPKEEVSFRAFSLAGILWEGIRCLIGVVPICGFPLPLQCAMPWEYFNGKVFYWCYNQLKDASDPDGVLRELARNNEMDLANFNQIYNTVVTGTDLG